MAPGVLRRRCGVAQVQQREGLYGLRCTLVLAGARAQPLSLWKVADAQMQAVMVDFYQLLLKGEGRSEALREAQKTMIATLQPGTYYQTAFVPSAVGHLWRRMG
jgi:CHAT domain-containing protein